MKCFVRNIGLIVIAILLVAVNYARAENIFPWKYHNTGQNHTILIPEVIEISINETAIDTGDYIGVFYDSLGTLVCAGYSEWKGMITAMSAWGSDAGNDGFASGEQFKFKIWDSSIGKSFDAIASFTDTLVSYDTYVSNGMSGLNSLKAYSSGEIILHQNWNFISSHISSLYSNEEVFAAVADNFLLIKDDLGYLYFPDLNINESQHIIASETYWIKMIEADTISLFGTEIAPGTEELITGFQFLPYIAQETASIESVFGDQLADVRLIRNDEAMLYWPEMNIFDLQQLNPNCAYSVNVLTDFTIALSGSDKVSFGSNQEYSTLSHFEVNPSDACMYFGIEASAWDTAPMAGDEIAIVDLNGNVFGAGVFANGNIGFPVWSDDKSSNAKDGFNFMEEFTIKLWRQGSGFESIIEVDSWSEGDSIFAENKFSIVGDIKTIKEPEIDEFDILVLSNLAQGEYYYDISVPAESKVCIDLYNINGQLISVLAEGIMPKGKSRFRINARLNLAKGIYLIRMQGAERLISKTFVVH